jgi:hypothetical protein
VVQGAYAVSLGCDSMICVAERGNMHMSKRARASCTVAAMLACDDAGQARHVQDVPSGGAFKVSDHAALIVGFADALSWCTCHLTHGCARAEYQVSS